MSTRIQEDLRQSVSLMADWWGSTEEECKYVPPEEVDASMGYKGMSKLTQAGWKAPKGDADGEHVLFYAYGPEFKKYANGQSQIGAWKYNDKTEMIEYWYSKDHCPGMCSSCCDGGGSNEPKSALNKNLNPSADQSAYLSYKLINKFKDGDELSIGSFGTFTLRNQEGRWVLEKDGKMLDHIYACSTKNAIFKWRE